MAETVQLTIDDARWEELVDLTGGDAAVCFQCGVCTAACPWGLVSSDTFSVRALVRRAQLGLPESDDALWLCTTCGQCEVYCPRGVSIPGVMRGLRHLVWEKRQTPKGLPSLLWSIFWNSNPWTQPPSQRDQWAKGLDVPVFDPAEHEILFYVGCTTSYDRRAQKVARALAQVLTAAGVAFGILGNDEPCCGEAALNVGHRPYFLEIAQQTAQVFAEKDVTRLMTVSPHCYDVFKNHYPTLGQDGVSAQHYTEYLAQLIENGRLAFNPTAPSRVTYHDPCYLARHNDTTAVPRRLLASIPGMEVVEMEHAGIDTICCGGGGGHMWLETGSGERMADVRIREARAVEAEVLVTACPFCIACLEDSLKGQGIHNLLVMDIAEVAAQALGSASDQK